MEIKTIDGVDYMLEKEVEDIPSSDDDAFREKINESSDYVEMRGIYIPEFDTTSLKLKRAFKKCRDSLWLFSKFRLIYIFI